MSEPVLDKSTLKQIFAHPTSRTLLGIWARCTGTRWPFRTLAEITVLPEPALEAKLQSLTGLGLVNVIPGASGRRQVEFLPCPNPDMERLIRSFFEGWKSDLEVVNRKVDAALYRMILSSTPDA